MLYGTGEGQTAKVADRIAGVLAEPILDARTVDVADVPSDLAGDDYGAVLVWASVHGGRHQPAVREFVRANREALAARPTAFFQLSLSSATETDREQAADYVEAPPAARKRDRGT